MKAPLGPIVSSAHLAQGALPGLSEVEFGLMLAHNAFARWIVRCMTAAGAPGLNALDVMVLHSVNHRGRAKRLADICLVLNIEDTHLVTYGLKKLEGLKLVKSTREAKERMVSITTKGADLCTRYGEIRDALLVDPLAALGLSTGNLSQVAAELRALSGHYDQAARAAASL
jgi:predicted MarR family transcription regulator